MMIHLVWVARVALLMGARPFVPDETITASCLLASATGAIRTNIIVIMIAIIARFQIGRCVIGYTITAGRFETILSTIGICKVTITETIVTLFPGGTIFISIATLCKRAISIASW